MAGRVGEKWHRCTPSREGYVDVRFGYLREWHAHGITRDKTMLSKEQLCSAFGIKGGCAMLPQA